MLSWRNGSVYCLTLELYSLFQSKQFDCGGGEITVAYSQNLTSIKFQNQHKNFKTLSFAHKYKREESLEIA